MKRELETWFSERGWKPFKFQKDVWKAIATGQSGLLHATTGAGKTYAVWLGALMAFGATAAVKPAQTAIKNIAQGVQQKSPPLIVLWITPMRALAADTLRALQQPLDFLKGQVVDDDGVIHPVAPGFGCTAGARSGDTASAERSAQNKRLPTVLVTTPESLSVMLSRADARDVLGSVKMVVVDEWHELLGHSNGTLVRGAVRKKNSSSTHFCRRAPNAFRGVVTRA